MQTPTSESFTVEAQKNISVIGQSELQAGSEQYKDQLWKVVTWLTHNNYPALPVAPAQDPHKYPKRNSNREIEYEKDGTTPKALFTGKNPSYLDSQGEPHLVIHSNYQLRLPTEQELETWFANPANGVGTLGGWNNTIWIDIDAKQFDSEEDCLQAFNQIMQHPALTNTFVEQTHSGGWRIGVRVKQKPDFTNFALSPGGKHIGEALGKGRFTVLAPTIGPSGNPYQSINCELPVEIESLESIGIHTTKKNSSSSTPKTTSPLPKTNICGAISLEKLGSQISQEILNGTDPNSDRSLSLVAAAREWYGWENWAAEKAINLSSSAEELIAYAAEKLSIESDRIPRILQDIDRAACNPAAYFKGGDEACWKKIRSVDKKVFEEKCPASIKDAIKASQGKKDVSAHTFGKTSFREAVAKAEEILKAQISSQLDPIEASIQLEEIRRESGVNEFNWERKYLKPIRDKLERSLALPSAQVTDPTERKRLELKSIAQERDPYKYTDRLIEFCRRTGWSRKDAEQQIRLFKTSTVVPKAKRLKGKDFLALETESISWVFPGVIPSRGVFVIGGHAGAGKTTFAYDAVGSLLLGEEFLGEKPTKVGGVLIVTGDELPCFTQDKLIDRGIPLDNENWDIILNWDVSQWDVLEEAIADLRPALVVIDSFSSIHRDPSFDENSSQAKSTIYDLEALTNAYNCGCILIHHLGKSKENKGVAKLRGSSAIAAAASVVCLMEKTSSDDTRILSFPKVRGAQTEPFLVAMDGSSGRYEVINGGDDPGTKSLGDRILELFQKSPYERFEQEEISQALGISTANKDSLYQALSRLFKRGLITKRPSQLGGKRKVYGLANPSQLSQCVEAQNLTDTSQDTHIPPRLNVSGKNSETQTECDVEHTDTLTDTLTDTFLTHQNDVPTVSDANDQMARVTAKLTQTDSQGCVCPPPNESGTYQPPLDMGQLIVDVESSLTEASLPTENSQLAQVELAAAEEVAQLELNLEQPKEALRVDYWFVDPSAPLKKVFAPVDDPEARYTIFYLDGYEYENCLFIGSPAPDVFYFFNDEEEQICTLRPISPEEFEDRTLLYLQTQSSEENTSIPVENRDLKIHKALIERTDWKMKELRWTVQKGQEYLLKKYGVRSRHLLKNEKLLDFLNYLQLQPTPCGIYLFEDQ